MKRNLESRVEVVAPVEDPQLRKELRTVIDIQLRPNRCQWEMQFDGVYVRTPAADAAPACQQALIDFADTRQTEATKVKKRRPKGFARRANSERNGE
jgi:polyphosphate kinase